jgi:transposase
MLTPVVRRTYAPRGKTPVQPCWDRHARISAISAITLAPDQQLDLCFTLLADNENAHGRDTICFLEQLQLQCSGPLTILWDRGNIHDRCAEVRDYLALHTEIVTEKFPAYAPELNPQEMVWNYTKYSKMPNFAPKSTTDLRTRLHNELSTLRNRKDLLASFVQHASPLLL